VDNILTNKDFILDEFNPKYLSKIIVGNFKNRRIELNITQKNLAIKSGISLGSLKRFEHKHEISLKNLLLLAVALNSTNEFNLLFAQTQYSSIDEIVKIKKKKTRKRARSND